MSTAPLEAYLKTASKIVQGLSWACSHIHDPSSTSISRSLKGGGGESSQVNVETNLDLGSGSQRRLTNICGNR